MRRELYHWCPVYHLLSLCLSGKSTRILPKFNLQCFSLCLERFLFSSILLADSSVFSLRLSFSLVGMTGRRCSHGINYLAQS